MNIKQITALIWNSDCSAETCRSLVTEIEELEQANENLKNCIEALVKSEEQKADRQAMGDFR